MRNENILINRPQNNDKSDNAVATVDLCAHYLDKGLAIARHYENDTHITEDVGGGGQRSGKPQRTQTTPLSITSMVSLCHST